MTEAFEYASYLVRIWREHNKKDATIPPTWVAEVESIQTGETRHFSELVELTHFFQALALTQEDHQE
ncbi:MAG: hypothetical protein PVJ75_10770 [Chloroflexota bacterium]|jgi:hypothetical protein